MKSVILAGGLGTRISEESYLKPKPMIEIGDQPILWHIMKEYSYYGVDDFIICLGYKGYKIKEYFNDYYLHTSDVTFDFKENKLQYASFSMPRILLQTTTGSIEKLPSNNLPIMPYVVDIAIDSVDLSNVSKVALFTDGIVESETKDGVLYSAYLNENFSQSPFLKSFFNNAYTYLDDFYDDVTLFFIRRPFTNIIKEKVYYFPTKYDKLDEASETIRQEMVDCGIDVDRHDSFFTALSECIMNAYEHGNLAITFAIKHELIKNGDYEEELLKKEKNNDKMITIRYVYCNDNESKYIIVGIRDEGAGYPETVFKNAIGDTTKFNGRGIKIIDYYTDIFFFSEDRREIFIGIKIK